jgi:hypothetical protein
MLLERCIVAIDFIDEQFCIILARHQDFKLKGAGLILQAAGAMRLEQWQEPIPLSFHNLDCRNQRKFGHDNRSSVSYCLDLKDPSGPTLMATPQSDGSNRQFFPRLLTM